MSVSHSLRHAAADAALLRDAASRAAACRAELQAALDELVTADADAVIDRFLILGRALVACDIDVARIQRLLDVTTGDDAESCAVRVAVADLFTAAIGQNRAGVDEVIAFCRADARRVVDWSRPVGLDLVETTRWDDVQRELHFRLATHLLRMADDPLYLAELELELYSEPEELEDELSRTTASAVEPSPAIMSNAAAASETAADAPPEPAGTLEPPPVPELPDGPSKPPTASETPKKSENEAKAIGLLFAEPNLSIPQIAGRVGVNHKTLYKMKQFRAAATVAGKIKPRSGRAGSIRRGHKTADGSLEAYQDEE